MPAKPFLVGDKVECRPAWSQVWSRGVIVQIERMSDGHNIVSVELVGATGHLLTRRYETEGWIRHVSVLELVAEATEEAG